MCHGSGVSDTVHSDEAGPGNAYRELPAQITLAETSTTHDTSATDAYGSLGAISSTSPLNVAIGPEGAGGGDGD